MNNNLEDIEKLEKKLSQKEIRNQKAEDYLKEIDALFKENSEESLKEIGRLIKEEEEKNTTGLSKDELAFIKLNMDAALLQHKIDSLDPNDYKESIHLRGNLIKLCKKAEKKVKDSKVKMGFRYVSLQQLKKQKETLKVYRKTNSKKISIPKKVGLNIKEIGKTINIFMKEKDVITKVKNVITSTALSVTSFGLLFGGISLGFSVALGLPFKLSMLASLFPAAVYSGLASIIRNFGSKSAFQQYQYYKSDEFKELVSQFMEENKDRINEIADITKQKVENMDKEERFEINNELIKKIDDLSKSTKIKAISDVFALQALSLFRENKEICEEIKDEYLNEENNDKEKYKLYNKKLMKINYQIYMRENSVKSALKSSGKNLLTNMKVTVITKLILSKLLPNMFRINGLSSFAVPFAYAMINGLIEIPTYKDKLKFKETEYEGKVELQNKKRIEEILGQKKHVKPALA